MRIVGFNSFCDDGRDLEENLSFIYKEPEIIVIVVIMETVLHKGVKVY